MAKKAQETLVTLLLDRSGSMESCRSSTIEAYNDYVTGLKKSPTPIMFTFLQFDSQSLDKVHFEKAINDIPNLNMQGFVPRGMTPLVESATKTIRALDEAIKKKKEKPKVVVAIQTDGYENASGPEYTWEALKALIETKKNDGWQFNFLGAGIDAYDQAAKMGVHAGGTVSYDSSDPAKTRSAFVGLASNTAGYASGLAATTDWNDQQKSDAGDQYFNTNETNSKDVDLTSATE